MAAALVLAWGVLQLLAWVLPGTPWNCADTSRLAAVVASQKPLSANSPHLWTEAIVWDKTRALVAASFKTDVGRVQRDTRLESLHTG